MLPRIPWFILTITLSSLAVLIAQVQQSQPTVDQIVDRYVQSLGGKSNVEKVTSRIAKGICENPDWEMKGPFEMYAKAPNKYLDIMSFSVDDVYQKGFSGKVGWEQDPNSGVRELSGGLLLHIQREANFYHDVRLRELYPTMKLIRTEKVGDRDAYVLEAIPPEGFADKLYFDLATGLLIRRDSQVELPNGRMTNVILYDDYRDVDGVMVPFSIYLSNFESGINIKLSEVKHNVPIDDARFEKPTK